MMGMLRPLHPKNMAKHVSSNEARLRRHQRIRRSLTGTETRPRLNVFRSGEHIYAQLINDSTGNTIVSASSLDESIRDFKASQSTQRAKEPSSREQANAAQTVAEVANNAPVQEQEARPASARSGQQKGSQQQKGGQQKGGQQQKGGGNRPAPAKTVLPTAQKGAKKTPVEALAPIASNRKVAIAREVGKLVAQRAKEKGVTTIVFDRGGYSYHGRVASLAEGAREAGLNF